MVKFFKGLIKVILITLGLIVIVLLVFPLSPFILTYLIYDRTCETIEFIVDSKEKKKQLNSPSSIVSKKQVTQFVDFFTEKKNGSFKERQN